MALSLIMHLSSLRVALILYSISGLYEFSVFQGGEEPAVEGGVGPRRATPRAIVMMMMGGSRTESMVMGKGIMGVQGVEAAVARSSLA